MSREADRTAPHRPPCIAATCPLCGKHAFDGLHWEEFVYIGDVLFQLQDGYWSAAAHSFLTKKLDGHEHRCGEGATFRYVHERNAWEPAPQPLSDRADVRGVYSQKLEESPAGDVDVVSPSVAGAMSADGGIRIDLVLRGFPTPVPAELTDAGWKPKVTIHAPGSPVVEGTVQVDRNLVRITGEIPKAEPGMRIEMTPLPAAVVDYSQVVDHSQEGRKEQAIRDAAASVQDGRDPERPSWEAVRKAILSKLQEPRWASTDPWEINKGECTEFADAVLGGGAAERGVRVHGPRVRRRLPSGRPRLDPLRGAALRCRVPWGVEDPRDLPIFARHLARLATKTDTSLAARHAVRDAVLATLRSDPWQDIDPDVINSGVCNSFANAVMSKLGQGVAVEDISTEEVWNDHPSLPGHVWLRCGGWHFDAECPWGVSNPLDLPIFARALASDVKSQLAPIPIAEPQMPLADSPADSPAAKLEEAIVLLFTLIAGGKGETDEADVYRELLCDLWDKIAGHAWVPEGTARRMALLGLAGDLYDLIDNEATSEMNAEDIPALVASEQWVRVLKQCRRSGTRPSFEERCAYRAQAYRALGFRLAAQQFEQSGLWAGRGGSERAPQEAASLTTDRNHR